MKLNAPRQITWIIAVVLGILGILGHTNTISFGLNGVSDFFLVGTGFVLLAVATFFRGL